MQKLLDDGQAMLLNERQMLHYLTARNPSAEELYRLRDLPARAPTASAQRSGSARAAHPADAAAAAADSMV